MTVVEAAAHKRCPSCGEVKPLGDFFRNRSQRDGHCQPCNQGIGLFRDDPKRLEAASRYLSNWY